MNDYSKVLLALQQAIIELEYAQERLGNDREMPRKNALDNALTAVRVLQGMGCLPCSTGPVNGYDRATVRQWLKARGFRLSTDGRLNDGTAYDNYTTCRTQTTDALVLDTYNEWGKQGIAYGLAVHDNNNVQVQYGYLRD